MPIVTDIRWTPLALRQLTEWVAAYSRDEITLRLVRTEYVEMIEGVIDEGDGYPAQSTRWGPADAQVVEWAFVAGELWVTHVVRRQPAGLLARLLGRRPAEVVIITALRRPRTAPERATLDT